MIPEFGQLSLIIAFFLALCLAVIPMIGSFTGRVVWMASSRSLAAGFFVFILIAFVILGYSFYVDDFSVAYVARHSNLVLPVQYKLSAVWGGHEGSLLLWILILSSWTFAVSRLSKGLPLDMLARVLSVMGMVAVGFMSFTLITSNPFDRALPNIPLDGGDLNPLLQDPGMIIHPPMLYMGYVGFSVVFAFAIAALISGRFDAAWARWSRPWTNAAWCFLTVGIALGSWWAYYELGWGGWWFWDPVENASLLPWLVGTALIHTLSMTEKRGVFKNWTLLLAIFAFSLSLLGTFLVRSGVLTSVHAFAADPTRGIFILGFLGVVVGGSLTLFAFRAPMVKSSSGFGFFSKEGFLLANTLLFFISANLVLLGTLYPLVSDALNMGKISVGAPWFNFFFTKVMGLVAALMGLGIMLNWKKTDFSRLRNWFLHPLLLSCWIGSFLPGVFPGEYSIPAAISITLGSWVILASLWDVKRKTSKSKSFTDGLTKLSRSYYGMIFAHIGFAVSLLGASLNTIYTDERDVRLTIGVAKVYAGYEYELIDVIRVRGANYFADVGEVAVRKNGKEVVRLKPQKRHYFSGGNVMTEADIDVGFFRDIYTALGEQLGNTDWSVRIHYLPVVRWIWLGALIMAFGGGLAMFDKRYKIRDEKLVVGDSEPSAEKRADGNEADAILEIGGEASSDLVSDLEPAPEGKS
ncbi:heme lyase CcmF/NrfE family subunit [Teredinibacter waterburyi]|uniref:heme lyase CcmF/NrfE family subunit n=1 Tax=Teredinibacter waterburyi TaxID=1500538 RepID=UPI00165F85F8|nr:heme lyase CcmF/NrfE family subunit [Teredinibacter waterburyi]